MSKQIAFSAITVDQLLALNEEIRSLTRAGVPLERGLRALGSDLPGRLGRLADSLGKRLERGESLVDALSESEGGFPQAYRAVVAAGMRTGKLSAALESVSRSVRQASELRRSLIMAMIYPFVLLSLSSIIFALSMWKLSPMTSDMVFGVMNVTPPVWYAQFIQISRVLFTWLPFIWVALLLGIVAWWFQSRSAAGWGSKGFKGLPTIGTVRNAGRMATFAELLAMLVEQEVPLQEGIRLAAAAGGGVELEKAGAMLANALNHGQTTTPAPTGIPPLLTWLIITSANQPHLPHALRQTADSYRKRAIRMSVFLGTYVPIFLSAFVGGGIVFYYIALTLGPFYFLLLELAKP